MLLTSAYPLSRDTIDGKEMNVYEITVLGLGAWYHGDERTRVIDSIYIPVCESGPSYFGVYDHKTNEYRWLQKVHHPLAAGDIGEILLTSRSLPSSSPVTYKEGDVDTVTKIVSRRKDRTSSKTDGIRISTVSDESSFDEGTNREADRIISGLEDFELISTRAMGAGHLVNHTKVVCEGVLEIPSKCDGDNDSSMEDEDGVPYLSHHPQDTRVWVTAVECTPLPHAPTSQGVFYLALPVEIICNLRYSLCFTSPVDTEDRWVHHLTTSDFVVYHFDCGGGVCVECCEAQTKEARGTRPYLSAFIR